MIHIKEVCTKKDLTAFIKFPFQLYKDSPHWIPPIIKEEQYHLDTTKNPAFKEHVKARLFLAYKEGQLAGRIAAIINQIEVEEHHQKKIRFGWFDVIDDPTVTEALFESVFEYGKQQGLTYTEGPCGFSNMDKAGMLTYGYNRTGNMSTHYNYSYYNTHLEQLGFEKSLEWVGYAVDVPEVREKVAKFAAIVLKRYQLKLLKFTTTKQLLPYAEAMFHLMNRSFKTLPVFIPIQPYQIEQYKAKYLRFIHPDFITFIADSNNELIAFSITMPSFSKALQKANGRLFPFGFLHLLKAQKNNDLGNLYLIGIDPQYQGKGLTALILKNTIENFRARNIKYAEMNPELEDNTAVRALWNDYDPKIIKRWRTYKKIY